MELIRHDLGPLLLDRGVHGAQGRLQEVRRRVGPHDGPPASCVHLGAHAVPHRQRPLCDRTELNDKALNRRLRVLHLEAGTWRHNHAGVAHLSALLAIEGGRRKHHADAVSGGRAVRHLTVPEDAGHDRLRRQRFVAYELRGAELLAQLDVSRALTCRLLDARGLAATMALFLEQCIEARAVELESGVPQKVLGQLHREAHGVMQVEGCPAGKGVSALPAHFLYHPVELHQAFAQRMVKALLLHLHVVQDAALCGHQLGEGLLHRVDDRARHGPQEGALDADHAA